MSWVAVLRKDFRDAVRSRTLWALLLVVTGVGLLVVYVYAYVTGPATTGSGGLVSWLLTLGLIALLAGFGIGGVGPIPVLVPLIGLFVGYKAIVGERETGRIKILLGLPHSRRDVLVGKYLGRAGVAAVAVGVGLVVTGLFALVALGGLAVGIYLTFVAVTVVFAVAHVGIGVGISALVPSDRWAVALLVGFVFVFQMLWRPLTGVAASVLFDNGPEPAWFDLVRHGSPGEAYGQALAAVLDVSELARLRRGLPAGGSAGGAEPFYLADWFGFVVLAVWTVVPLAVGYWRFRAADLG